VTHVYPDGPNTFTIRASATDEDGTYAAAPRDVTVNNVAPTVTIGGASQVDVGDSFTLNLSAANDPGADTIASWTVNWGDGATQTVDGNPSSLTHLYANPSKYTVSATTTDEDGTYPSNSIQVEVRTLVPVPTLSGNPAVN